VFTAFYLGCEVILKLSLSAKGAIEHRLPLFIIFTALSVGSALMMLFVRSVALPGDQVKRIPMCEKVGVHSLSFLAIIGSPCFTQRVHHCRGL
jgi:hypothetical protein